MGLSYYLFFTLLGAWAPFFAPTLASLGYAPSHIGLATGLLAACMVVTPLVVGRFSDRHTHPAHLIRWLALGATFAVTAVWATATQGTPLFWLALLAYGLSKAPLIPLQDALALERAAAVAASQSKDTGYTRKRVMGSAGFMVASATVGYAQDLWGEEVMFPIAMAAALALHISAYRLLPPRRRVEQDAPVPPGANPNPVTAFDDGNDATFWRHLSWPFWGWIAAMACHWICMGAYHFGFSLYLRELGVSSIGIGGLWALGTAAEIVVFSFAHLAFRRASYRQLLFCAIGAGALRWIILAMAPPLPIIAASQLLHGLTFALFYAAALHAMDKASQGRLRASFQGLFSTAVIGFGSVVGATTAGALNDHMPFAQVFAFLVPVAFVGILLLWVNPLKSIEKIAHARARPKPTPR